MATPKTKRDLRARLGRTITPKTKGDAPAAPPGVAPPPGAAAEPAAPAAAPAAAAPAAPAAKPKVTPPPAGVTPPPKGVAAPPPGIGAAPSAGIAAPPFAQPAPAAPAAPAGPADPFASAAPVAQEKVVRLEFDDRLVQDAEVGKGRSFVVAIVGAITLVLGGVLGYVGGSTVENNKIFDRTVRDAQSLYVSVNDASSTVTAAQRHMNAIVAAAAGNESEGTRPGVDYDSITALRALEKPFDASAFTGKNYNALPAETVHDLFQYLMNVERIWQEISALAATTLAETARAALDESAAAVGESANTTYGLVLGRNDDGVLVGSLAFMRNGSEEGQFEARATRNGRAINVSLFNGAEDQTVESGTPQFFVLIDGAQSRGVLAEQTGAFGRFLNDLRELKPLIDQTVEIQGRILQSISQALTEAGATVGPPPAE